MGLKLSNRATPKQVAMLDKLGYIQGGAYAAPKLTMEEAAQLIDELLEEQRLNKDEESVWDYQ